MNHVWLAKARQFASFLRVNNARTVVPEHFFLLIKHSYRKTNDAHLSLYLLFSLLLSFSLSLFLHLFRISVSRRLARAISGFSIGALLASSFNGIAVADYLDEQGNTGKTNPLKILLLCSAKITRSTKHAERTPLVFPFNVRAPVPITDAIARANSC